MNDSTEQRRPSSWWASCPCWILLRSFSIAKSVHVLLLATVGVLAMTAGWRLFNGLLSEEFRATRPVIDADASYFGTWPGQRTMTAFTTSESVLARLPEALGPPPESPLWAMPYRVTAPFVRFLDLDQRGRAPVYYGLGLTWTVLVWAFFGAAICRMAAMKFARDERMELTDAVRFAQSRTPSHLGAFLLPLVGIAALAVPVAVLGLLMYFNIGVILTGLLWIFVVAFSFMMVLLLGGLLLGWPLMWGALACEGSDAFDAVSRAFAYVFQRPFRFVAYVVFAGLVGFLGWIVVWAVSEGMISLGWWSAALGAGRERVADIVEVADGGATSSNLVWFGAHVIGFWNGVIRTVATGFAYSYLFVAMTGVYLILRRDVDGAEVDEIYLDPAAISDSGHRVGTPEASKPAAAGQLRETDASSDDNGSADASSASSSTVPDE